MESVRGKVVLITGASAGIGASTAVLFAKYGSKLALHGRNKDGLAKVAGECHQWGLPQDQILTITGDLQSSADIKRIMEETIATFGTLNVLVNNAAHCSFQSLETVTMEEFDKTFNVNLRAVVQLTQLAIPHLKSNKGCVVNVSSDCSARSSVTMAPYCLSKAALDMFTTTLAIELGRSGVRVNSVNPGEIKTSMQTRMGIPKESLEQFYETTGACHPLGRCGLPQEVAPSIVFLASDAAAFVTGAILAVDGGQSKTASWFFQELEQAAQTSSQQQ